MRNVAIQGAPGSYSEHAAIRLCGASASIHGYGSFFETFEAILVGDADSVVVPVENSIVGTIRPVADLLSQSDLQTVSEFPMQIEHLLIGTASSRPEDIVRIRSHPEALKQCADFLAENPQIQVEEGCDTGGSVRRVVREGDSTIAAIGGIRAANKYQGKILMRNIQNDDINVTTFLLLEKSNAR